MTTPQLYVHPFHRTLPLFVSTNTGNLKETMKQTLARGSTLKWQITRGPWYQQTKQIDRRQNIQLDYYGNAMIGTVLFFSFLFTRFCSLVFLASLYVPPQEWGVLHC